MAKKGLDLEKTAKTNMSASVERTNAYANKVKQMFDETVKEILKIKRTLPKIADGEMFSFDAQPPKVQKEVEVLLRRLSSAVTLATEEGIELEWEKANKAVDGIISTVIGKNVLNDENFSGWQNRNKTAMRDFIRRTENAMSLSDRIWQTTRQLREELEVAMTVSIGEGKSAAEMSRDVRQYLNDPDLMFRRFRYKVSEKIVDDFDAEGNKIGSHKEIEWGRKWKKKIKDKTGKVKWVDYDKDSYKVGRGVYKSASKNAMRVTRTETNMAYRRADQTRYRQLDFVQGYHIEPVKDHDEDDCEPDICRQLAGDYPKDFIFEGWHPQCRCVCTPILIGQDDAIAMFRAKLHGEDYKKPQQITDYPQGFKDWCKDNADKIKETHKKGKDPYFVRHNMGVVDGILNPQVKKRTSLEIAEERHANRTEEQVSAIKKKVVLREKAIKSAETLFSDFEGFKGVDITALKEAYKHARWDDVRAEALKLAQVKRSIIETGLETIKKAEEYGEIDIKKLNSAIKSGKLSKMQSETQSVENSIAQTKIEEDALKDLIPNAHTLHKTYKITELQEVHRELSNVMNKWLAKYKYKSLDTADLQHLKNKLDFELTNSSTNYIDKKLVNIVIKEKILEIDKKIEWNNLLGKVQSLKSFSTKSVAYKAILIKIDSAIQSNEANALKIAINDAETLQQKLMASRIKRGGDTKTALNKEYKGGVVGSDISQSVNVKTMISEDPYDGSRFTNNVARMQGFDAPAKLVSDTEFSQLEKACGEVFYRTVNPTNFKGKQMTSKEFASQLYVADLLELNGPGGRVYGDGMYVATSSWDGSKLNPLSDKRKKVGYNSSIYYGNGKHTITEMTWTRPPKIIKETELTKIWSKLSGQEKSAFGNNMNTYGCALGYDAMLCDGPNYMVIWNRSIIAVKK